MAAKKPRHPDALTLEQALELSRRSTPVGEFAHHMAPTRYRATIVSTFFTPDSTVSVEHSLLYHDGDITYGLCATVAGHTLGTYRFFTDDRGRHYHGSPISDVRVRDAYDRAKEAWRARCEKASHDIERDGALRFMDGIVRND